MCVNVFSELFVVFQNVLVSIAQKNDLTIMEMPLPMYDSDVLRTMMGQSSQASTFIYLFIVQPCVQRQRLT